MYEKRDSIIQANKLFAQHRTYENDEKKESFNEKIKQQRKYIFDRPISGNLVKKTYLLIT